MYAHPKDAKGIGKPKGDGKGKNGKQRSASNSSRGGKGAGGGKGQASPRTKAVTDVKLLCKNYLKGKCDKGKDCKYHHNGPCAFFKKGTCKRGDDCVYQHSSDPAIPAVPAVATKPTAKKGAKKDGENA
jgi:hypothetical protein